MLKSCGSSSKGAQDLQCVIRLINAIRTFTMNGTRKKKNSFLSRNPRVSTETGPEALRDVALVTGDKMITANVG